MHGTEAWGGSGLSAETCLDSRRLTLTGRDSGMVNAAALGMQLLAPTPVVRPTHKQSVLAEEMHLQAWWPTWLGTQAWPT